MYDKVVVEPVYPVCGANVPSSVILSPAAILSAMVISVASVLSVFHFSVNERPNFGTTYLDDRLPNT